MKLMKKICEIYVTTYTVYTTSWTLTYHKRCKNFLDFLYHS